MTTTAFWTAIYLAWVIGMGLGYALRRAVEIWNSSEGGEG